MRKEHPGAAIRKDPEEADQFFCVHPSKKDRSF
jgi:hypothetical protein